jgi:hypothetical protein
MFLRIWESFNSAKKIGSAKKKSGTWGLLAAQPLLFRYNLLLLTITLTLYTSFQVIGKS